MTPDEAKKLAAENGVDYFSAADLQAAFSAEMMDEQADLELELVLTWLRRHERDQLLGITPPSISDLIVALERGEHRR